MLISEENNLLFNIYNHRIIKENPDILSIGDDEYNYDDKNLGNYTGFMYPNGKFVMSKIIMGHGKLRRYMNMRELGDFPDLKHNFDSIDDIYNLQSGANEFRLWPRFKIFSLWDYNFKPEYKAAIDAILNSIGDHDHLYKFDPHLYNDNFKSYDEFVKDEIGEDELAAIEHETKKKAENARLMADMLAGNGPKRRSMDVNAPQRVPEWKRREGD